ncbi:MAG TPA: PEP-CTERM sorting domain-containing protein [Nostocaceae cyanobacterium]|nr:PEP-CTERM sorting domain-containing protein [Nostocaceae cyanobacterium]
MKNKLAQLLGSTFLATGIASAVMTAPVNAATLGVCSTTDVSLGGVNAVDCFGASGNDTGADDPLETWLDGGLFSEYVGTGADWSLLGKSDSNSDIIQAPDETSIGNWTLGQPLPSSTFVISLKASDFYSAYLFQNVDFAQTGLTGLFNTIGVAVNKNGKAMDLSHASVFVMDKPGSTNPTPVPEPTTLIGLGLVASGILVSRRFKLS